MDPHGEEVTVAEAVDYFAARASGHAPEQLGLSTRGDDLARPRGRTRTAALLDPDSMETAPDEVSGAVALLTAPSTDAIPTRCGDIPPRPSSCCTSVDPGEAERFCGRFSTGASRGSRWPSPCWTRPCRQ